MSDAPLLDEPRGRWRQLALMAAAVLLSMALWFSATAVVGQLTEAWSLSDSAQAWLTMSVQIGFVVGALLSAILNLADRFLPHRFMAVSALLGCLCNGVIAAFVSDEFAKTDSGFSVVIALRFCTGVTLAGVYPPGMKMMASWFRSGRGLAIGVLVGALTIGSASPHLLIAPLQRVSENSAVGWSPWRLVLLGASTSALASAVISGLALRPGPLLASAAKFDWSYGFRMWGDTAVRRANFGYLGHMWELYAMWTWAPKFLSESYRGADWGAGWASVAGFSVIAIGGLGCVAAGAWADRLGRTTMTIASLVVSGGCALVAGFLYGNPLLATAICLVWGFAVVADSAQFSTAVTELADPKYVGTALTIQTCVGFSLTLLTIRLAPWLRGHLDWGPAFAVLALGPAFGVWHMARLRWMPEAKQMASGNR